jgi:hypothetical protein
LQPVCLILELHFEQVWQQEKPLLLSPPLRLVLSLLRLEPVPLMRLALAQLLQVLPLEWG